MAQVRRKGATTQSRTFGSLTDAKAWASQVEADIEAGAVLPSRRQFTSTKFRDLIERYGAEVTPSKRSGPSEQARLKQLGRHPIAQLALSELTAQSVAGYRDQRLASVSPATARRELALLSHIIEVARREWGMLALTNPVKVIRQPPAGQPRSRRLQSNEASRLFAALSQTRNPDLKVIVSLAIETGMRRSEILSLDWSFIDLKRHLLHIPITKLGSPRTIAITSRAVGILSQLQPKPAGRVFSISVNAFRLAWQRAVRRSGISNLRFHDLRHEAVSRFFEMGLTVPEVASISGHRDPRVLFRYTHLQPQGLAAKLRDLTTPNSTQTPANQ